MGTKTVYHVFTDGKDCYTTDEIKAWALYKQWCSENMSVRLWTLEDDGEELIDVDCIATQGDFPC